MDVDAGRVDAVLDAQRAILTDRSFELLEELGFGDDLLDPAFQRSKLFGDVPHSADSRDRLGRGQGGLGPSGSIKMDVPGVPYARAASKAKAIMVEINPAQLALALLTMVLLSTILAMFAGWSWMFWRLATGQSLLPGQPLVSLSPPGWRGGTVLLAFSTYVVMNVLVAGLYARAQGRAPCKPAPAVKPAEKSVKPDKSAKGELGSNPGETKENTGETKENTSGPPQDLAGKIDAKRRTAPTERSRQNRASRMRRMGRSR